MIVRLWKGRTSAAHAGVYQAHVAERVFPALAGLSGYLRGRVLRRTTGDEVEFLVVTEWASWEAIRAFAGADPGRAVIDPEARAVLTEAGERVEHYEVAHEVSAGL